jgi:hypothetical protein
MNPFENKTPQQIAALYRRGTEYRQFISELVNSKCKEAGIDTRNPNSFSSSSGFLGRSKEAQDFIDKTQKQVGMSFFGDLVEGRLIAAGKRYDVEGDTPPEVIPWEFWQDATSSYAGLQFATKHMRFGDIRILDLAQVFLPPADHSDEGKKPIRPKMGRHPTRPEFERAFAALRGTEGFEKLANRTEQAREIRAFLRGEEHRKSDGMSGFKTETLKRWIGEALGREV